MKKLFLLIATILLAFTITACGGTDEPVGEDAVTSITLSGVTDKTIMVDDVFNVFTGVVATGSDGLDYSDQITADSDNCTINADGSLSTSIQASCIINYAVVVNSKLDTAVANVKIDKEAVVVDDNAPLLMGWTFDDESALVGWSKYTNGAGTIAETVEDGALKLVTTSGGLVYETRFEYMGVPFEIGTDYVISFKAKADIEGKGIHLQLGELLPSDPWFTDFKPGQIDDVYLTTEWADYSFAFTMTLANVKGGLLFEMGNMADSENLDATIWVDDIEVRGGSGLDNAPVILGVDDVTVVSGKAFDTREGVTVNDFVDGDLLDSLHVYGDSVNGYVPGVYTASYYIKDSVGNRVMVDRVITVIEDVEAPVLTGTDNADVPLNSLFNPMSGVMAMDNGDGDITNMVMVTGMVDVTTPGEYTLTYTIKDKANNSFTVDRVITITDIVFVSTDLVENGTFDLPGWGSWMADWNSTSAVITFDDGVAKLDIADVGAENWNIQLFQNGLTFVQDQQYIVTFDAMSTVARDINLKIIDDLTKGEIVSNISLTTTMETYTFIFTFAFDTGLGNLNFELGGAAGGIVVSVPSVVTFDNMMVEEYDGAAAVADSDMLVNGDFEMSALSPWASWSRDWDPAITSTLEVADGAGMFTYNGVGDATWQAKVEQGQFAFVTGQTYRITFDAKGSLERDFHVSFYDGAQDFRSDLLALGTEWASYQYTFVWDSENTGLLQFELGLHGDAAGGIFYIDNVEILEAASLNYVATEFVENGTFELPGWGSWMADWNTTSATVSFDDGAAVLDIADVGAENWNIQMFQNGLTLVKDQQYIVTFDAMSTVERDINLKIIDDLTKAEIVSNISLTTTMDTYTFIFTFTFETGLGNLNFELGGAMNGIAVSVPSVVTFDNMMVEEYDGTAAVADSDMLVNGDFEMSALSPWASWSRDWDPAITSTLEVVDGAAMFTYDSVGDATWQAKVEQGQFAFVTGKTYRVTFDAKGSLERDFHVSFYDGGQDFRSDLLALGTEWNTYQFSFVWDSANTALMQFELGQYGDAAGGVFYLDNVLIEVLD